MKKNTLILSFLALSLLAINSAMAQYDDSNTSNSSIYLETETINNVFTSSNDDLFEKSSNASESFEVKVENGITTLKIYDSDSGMTNSMQLGVNPEGMKIETENGTTMLIATNRNRDLQLEENIAGRILLQVEDKGQAWYIDPITKAKIYLGRPYDAFQIMREHGLGISNNNLNLIARSNENVINSDLAKRLAGRILLQVEDKGQAWYVDPVTLKRHFLGRPADAFMIMNSLGLGISNARLEQVRLLLGKVGQRHLTIALLADNNSNEFGIAQIQETAGKINVKISLTGAPTSSQPAHIHVGNRPNLGAIKYSLNDVVNGRSETTLNITLDQLLSERPLGINIHKSAAEMGISVASGNL